LRRTHEKDESDRALAVAGQLKRTLGWRGSLAIAAAFAVALASAALAAPDAAPATTCPPVARPPVGEKLDETPSRKVRSAAELEDVLRSDFKGRVIVPKDVDWEMKRPCGGFDELGRCIDTPMHDIPIHSGVQLVGERGELASRPTLRASDRLAEYSLFKIECNDVRVEGLHLVGPAAGSRDKTKLPFYVNGVSVVEDAAHQTGRRIVIADNEMDQWAGGAVDVRSSEEADVLEPEDYDGPRIRPEDAGLVRVERNYLHHNARDEGGYGVVVGGNSYTTIEGNVFDFNRHAIASNGHAFNGYVARFNYVLEGGYTYGGNGYYGQHFDVHGTSTPEERAEHHYDGGRAGEKYEIAFNTLRGEQNYGGFLGIGSHARAAFELRGRPAIRADFTNNVVVHDDTGEAIRLKGGKDQSLDTDSPSTFNLHSDGNRFDADYSAELAAGDFDGDGRTDVFVANGTAWFFSRAGVRPWELLHESTKRTDELGFADIDNDGVTDVLYRDSSGNVGYLKGGRGGLVPLTSAPVAMKELRFGDFDADGLTDIFHTQGGHWHVWYGRTRTWTQTQDSSKPISELLFGEFDGVRGTDVVGVNNSGWSYSSAATGGWVRFNGKLTRSFAKAVAADLDGNGKTDILVDFDGEEWRYSRDGRTGLDTRQFGIRSSRLKAPLKRLPIGRFDGGMEDRIITFMAGDNRFRIWRGLLDGIAFFPRSSQPMR
jgi:hypothetical protein